MGAPPASKRKVARLKSAARAAQPRHPSESHTDDDRAALDRLLTERAQR
jgi:hypothetical protein